LGKRNLYARFVPHSLTPEQREDQVTSCQDGIAMADAHKNSLRKLLRETRPGVLPVTPKQSDRVLSGLLRYPLGRSNWVPKSPHQDHVDSFFFRQSRRSVQRILTRGKKSKCRFF
jgi:hypothetical protein